MGSPDSRLYALCPSAGCLRPCPVICPEAGMFPVPRAVPGQCGHSINVCERKGRINGYGRACKDWPWAHTPAPWRAPILLYKLRPSDRRWRCPANTQETLRGWADGRPLTGTQIPEPKTPGEEVHRPQMLSPQGPQVSSMGLILGGTFGEGGTRGGMRHRGRPGREPQQDIQDKADHR